MCVYQELCIYAPPVAQTVEGARARGGGGRVLKTLLVGGGGEGGSSSCRAKIFIDKVKNSNLSAVWQSYGILQADVLFSKKHPGLVT